MNIGQINTDQASIKIERQDSFYSKTKSYQSKENILYY